MEHEFEKIRNKVLEAEQNPVAWERELVWSKITQPERKQFMFYYAAASLLIASALFFYAYENTKQKEIELELKAIELSIEKNKAYQAKLDEQSSAKVSIACPDPVVSQGPPQQTNKKTRRQKIPVPIIEEQQDQDKINNQTVAVTEEILTTPETLAQITENTSTKKVQAIIGNNDLGSMSTTRDKKLKFRLFLPEENTETVPAAAETISFHSKIN